MNAFANTSPDEKLRYQLDVQAHQIDAVLGYHQVDGAVTSGTVRQRFVEFDVQTPLSAGLERVRSLKESMMAALGVGEVAVGKHDGRWQVRVGRDHEPPVPLATLLRDAASLPPATAVIGLSDGNKPVMLRFSHDDVRHVLVAGDDDAGKTTLLRTMAISLALTNRQSAVQLLVMNGGPETEGAGRNQSGLWGPLAYLPHLMTDVVNDAELGAEVLRFLVGEMTYRRRQRIRLPRIVVLIDNAVALLEAGGQAVVDDVLRLLQHGTTAGIHLVLATARPEAVALDALFMSNLSVRLAGKLGDPGRARKVLGSAENHAEYLRGKGEFVALTNGELSYFQAADMSDYDLHWELNLLLNGSQPRLLALPFDERQPAPTAEPAAIEPKVFKRENSNSVQWVSPPPAPQEVTATPATKSSWSVPDEGDEW